MTRRSQEEWEELFAEQSASGLSVQRFCAQRGLCNKYFGLRRKQLHWQRASVPVAPTKFVRVRRIAKPESIPHSVLGMPSPSGEHTRVIVRHGRSELELQSVSADWLARLLVALA